MHCKTRPLRPFTPALVAIACALWMGAAQAQPHIAQEGAFTLRSSVVSSESIAEETAREHGIAPGPQTAVLNVLVLKEVDGTQMPVAANVSVTRTTLAGVRRDIALKEVKAEGRVSYLGSFDIVPSEVLDISVTARVDPSSPELRLSYRERMAPFR